MIESTNKIPATRLLSAKGWSWLLGLFLIAAIVIPILNRAVSADSAFYIPDWVVETLGKYMCYAIMALAIDLIWGYTGILSLGHAFFFALGAYIMGMHLVKYMNDVLQTVPDFMQFMPWKEFPWFWNGFENFGYGLMMAMLVPALIAFVLGYFAFRSRIKGVYFAIITQALTFAMWRLFLVNETGFGGNNGFTNFKGILGFTLANDAETKSLGLLSDVATTKLGLYIVTVVVLCLCFLVCRYIVTSKLGRVLKAVRDAEPRVAFSGYNTQRYKLFVWTVSAVLCAIGGILFVPQVGIINPSELDPTKSIEAVVWVAVGGRGTLVGAILGSGVVNGTKTLFTTGDLASYWLFILGGLAIIVTLFFPGGLIDKASHIKVAQSIGRIMGATDNRYAFSNLIPLLVLAFYFGFIALIADYSTGHFLWTDFKSNCLWAILALPLYILVNAIYQKINKKSLSLSKLPGQQIKQIIDIFAARRVIVNNCLYGALLIMAGFIASAASKWPGTFVLLCLFIVPLMLIASGKWLSLKRKSQLYMASYILLTLILALYPAWFVYSGFYIGVVLLIVLSVIPFSPLFKNAVRSPGVKTLSPIIIFVALLSFLFLFAENYLPVDKTSEYFFKIDKPYSFFLQVTEWFFSLSGELADKAKIEIKLFFILCALTMSYYLYQNRTVKSKGLIGKDYG